MPRAKNKKRTTGTARPNAQAAVPDSGAARDSGAAPRDLVPSQEVPPGLAGRREARAGDDIPAGLARRREGRHGGDTAQALARRPGGAGLRGVAVPRTLAGGAVTVAPGAKPGVTSAPAASGQPVSGQAADDVPQWAARALAQLLTVTYWLDPGERGERFSATIRFTGHRTDVAGLSQPGDTFSREEAVDGIVPGSGPVAVTAEVRDINPGTWAVTAKPVKRVRERAARAAEQGRVPWPRHVRVPASGSITTVRTATILRSKVPGVIRYAYACLVALGVLTGLAIEALLLGGAHYALLRPMAFSVAAVAAGVVGGKTWYAAVHRGRKWDGWCIQGFVAGAAVVVAVVAAAGPGLPAGAFLAAATPALLTGMGIGRHGCFWAGCCTGRPTASRWGVWSSDRRVGCRRMPVQLFEAWTALAVGAAALAAVLLAGLHRSGTVAVAGLAAYTLIRQLILGLRDEPRHWRHGRLVTGTAAAIALIAGLTLFAVSA
jgi:phosphatidylglycerol:prolipoprotein diacylglycerol transferase